MTRSMRVLDQIVSRLKAINGGNGFYFDLGERVYKGRYRFTKEDNFPVISVNSSGDTAQQVNGGDYSKHKVSKVVEIHGIVAVSDINNPVDDAEMLVADIKRAIFSKDERLGGNSYTIEYSGTFIGDLDESVNMISCQVNIAAVFAEDLSNPDF